MTVYTIGFTKKTANQFFGLININNIEVLLDIRLNNKSQLAGFTKGDDLRYFLSEICKCKYEHCLQYAPTDEILNNYKGKKITWLEYEKQYLQLLETRGDYKKFLSNYAQYSNICLLCSEPVADQCHRRLLAEKLAAQFPQLDIKHL